MFGYIIRRILAIIPVLLIVAAIVFLMLRLSPGDPAAILAGDAATPAQIERIRTELGLNEPLHVQFLTWIRQLLQGDLGTSLISRTDVWTMIERRLDPTINIAILTIIISVLLAVPMGVLAAWKHRTWVDYLVMSFSVLGFSIPVFVIGYIFIGIFSLQLRWLPVQGYTAPSEDLWGFFQRAILPSLTLATIYIALIARMTRASMLEVLNEDYVRTARAKGLRHRRVLAQHVLRNSLVPVLSAAGPLLGAMVTTIFVVEVVFAVPGLARHYVSATTASDYPLLLGMTVALTLFVIVANLLVDLALAVLDPRQRERGR